jgi:hypothetical protein
MLNILNPKVILGSGENYETKAETKLHRFEPMNIWGGREKTFPKELSLPPGF